MRVFFISIMLILGMFANADAALRAGGSQARSAVNSARTVQPSQSRTLSSRESDNQQEIGRAAVVSRAATTKQKVINSGTKVATATANTIVSEECQNKYYGCMDSFCMVDNTNGGRCLCSNRHAELENILSEIEKLDMQTYQMATYGVEKIEMGADADETLAKVEAVTKEAMDSIDNKTVSGRRTIVDTSLWNSEFELDDVFSDEVEFEASSEIDSKRGDELQVAAHQLCVAQVPECAADINMLKLLYTQKIKSDCSAYENSLKQQKNASQTKLATAERALREAALEQLRAANKYDLGECTVHFKECMQTTGGCGKDFSACTVVAASDNTNVNKSTSKQIKKHAIKGASTTIEIMASTYDTLMAKKPLCETVTKQCSRVADQVWDTFLRDVAPAIKSAELIAEDNLRQNCIGNIAQCFQKACKDSMDPNDPDGSYDMCLTRPETMLNVCKMPLNACGIDASSTTKAKQSKIWEYVVARLAAMRVDSCTSEVKTCLQSEDRCGKDYTQCVGLDTDTIMRMCPYEKMVGCQMVYENKNIRGEAVYDEIANMVQGIMLNIENSMLTACQRAADEAMIKVCGDTENCNGLTVDNGTGTRSFKYEICEYTSLVDNKINWGAVCRDSIDAITETELVAPPSCAGKTDKSSCGWAGKLSGTMYWGDISYSCTENKTDGVQDCGFTNQREYVEKLKTQGYTIDANEEKIISERVFGMEMSALINAVNSAIDAIESDPTVHYCMTGRQVAGMKIGDEYKNFGTANPGRGKGRFPNLTQQMKQTIALSALKTARENYNKKYDTEMARMMQDQVKVAERIDKNAAIEAAKVACENWAKPFENKPESPKVNNAGKWIGTVVLAAAAITVVALTAGTSAVIVGAVAGSVLALGSGGMGLSTAVPVGESSVEEWNYSETVVTSFAPSTGICTKVRTYKNCAKVKNNYCETWDDPQEVRDEVNLL